MCNWCNGRYPICPVCGGDEYYLKDECFGESTKLIKNNEENEKLINTNNKTNNKNYDENSSRKM